MNWALWYLVRQNVKQTKATIECLMSTDSWERNDTKSKVKLGRVQSQLEASYVSSHTEELWYNETACLWRTIYIYIYIYIHSFSITDIHPRAYTYICLNWTSTSCLPLLSFTCSRLRRSRLIFGSNKCWKALVFFPKYFRSGANNEMTNTMTSYIHSYKVWKKIQRIDICIIVMII